MTKTNYNFFLWFLFRPFDIHVQSFLASYDGKSSSSKNIKNEFQKKNSISLWLSMRNERFSSYRLIYSKKHKKSFDYDEIQYFFSSLVCFRCSLAESQVFSCNEKCRFALASGKVDKNKRKKKNWRSKKKWKAKRFYFFSAFRLFSCVYDSLAQRLRALLVLRSTTIFRWYSCIFKFISVFVFSSVVAVPSFWFFQFRYFVCLTFLIILINYARSFHFYVDHRRLLPAVVDVLIHSTRKKNWRNENRKLKKNWLFFMSCFSSFASTFRFLLFFQSLFFSIFFLPCVRWFASTFDSTAKCLCWKGTSC